jgi:hypothetical protein
VTDKWVDLIDGASASMRKMSREEFERCWSGVALLPATNRQAEWVWLFGGVGLGLLGTLGLSRAAVKSGNR